MIGLALGQVGLAVTVFSCLLRIRDLEKQVAKLREKR